MARKTETVTISADGRDRGKTFVLTELPAEQAEEWFIRATALLVRSGADVPAGMFQAGPAAFFAIGVVAALMGLGRAPWAEVKPLLDEMFACVAWKPNIPQGLPTSDRHILDAQIEEVATRLLLRERVLSLHLGFSVAAKLLSYPGLAAFLSPQGSPTTSTSPAPSAPS